MLQSDLWLSCVGDVCHWSLKALVILPPLLFVPFLFRPGTPTPLQESSWSPFQNKPVFSRSWLITSKTITENNSGAPHFSLYRMLSFPLSGRKQHNCKQHRQQLPMCVKSESFSSPSNFRGESEAKQELLPELGLTVSHHGGRGQMQWTECKWRPRWGRQGSSEKEKGWERRLAVEYRLWSTIINLLNTTLLCNEFRWHSVNYSSEAEYHVIFFVFESFHLALDYSYPMMAEKKKKKRKT